MTLGALLGDIAATVREQLAAAHADERARDAELRRRREPLAARLAALSTTATHEPAAPRLRTAPRGERPGGPLWRLVDWRADVPAAVQTAVEAALEASGLLDAWIWPDGSVTSDRRGHDTYLAAATALPAPQESLLAVLDADERAPVPASLVATALAGVAFGPSAPHHVAAVGADGTWRLGPAVWQLGQAGCGVPGRGGPGAGPAAGDDRADRPTRRPRCRTRPGGRGDPAAGRAAQRAPGGAGRPARSPPGRSARRSRSTGPS